MKIIYFVLLIGLFQNAFAQTGDLRADTDAILNDLNRLRSKTFADVEGSPYFSDKWETGNIILQSKAIYKDIWLNIDLYSHELHYLRDQIEVILDTEKIKEVQVKTSVNGTVIYHIFRTGFPAIDRNTSKTFYVVLAEGPRITLLKLIQKSIKVGDEFDRKSKFASEEIDYLFMDNQLVELKKKKTLFKVFPASRKELDEFIEVNSISFSSDQDLIELISFLNRLKE